MNSYDTKTWAWEAQINALKSELDVQVAENERLAQDYNTARDAHDALLLENERLRAALKRMLLEFDFMVENGVIPDVRNDIIFVYARAALGGDA